MPDEIIIRPKWMTIPIMVRGITVGELNFDYVDYRCPVYGNDTVNVAPEEYLTKRRQLRAPIAKALGISKLRVNRAFIGTGTWVNVKYAGKSYGRRAMDLFLHSWATMADIVIINAQPIGSAKNIPDREKLIDIWSSIGFVLPNGFTRRMFFLPCHSKARSDWTLKMLKAANQESREQGYL